VRSRLLPSVVKLQLVLVAVAPVLVLAVIFVRVIQPRMQAAAAARARAVTLQQRVNSMQATLAGGPDTAAARAADILPTFERRLPSEDRVPDVLEHLAQRALGGNYGERLRNLVIEAGERVTLRPVVGSQSPRLADLGTENLDPRLELFPVMLSYRPITIAFDSSYSRAGRFLWAFRALPTLVEIRSVEVGPASDRALVHIRLLIVAFQRAQPSLGPQREAPEHQGNPPKADAVGAPSRERQSAVASGDVGLQASDGRRGR